MSDAPPAPEIGQVVIDTDTDRVKAWDGAKWVDITGNVRINPATGRCEVFCC